jgi:LysM repeat protein
VVEASTPTLFAPTVILGADLTRAAVPTVDETLQAGDPETAATVAALPANCIPYTITEGDTPFGIALELGADFTELMTVNQLTEESASLLQIGQVLIVPLPGCALAAEAAAPTLTQDAILALTPSSTPTEVVDGATTVPGSGQANAGPATTIPTPTATLQLPPTAANALVQISSVVGVGDVTAEGITILNTGTSISLNGWTVRDADGNTYTFSDRRLFPNAQVILFSGVGQDTAAAVYWNRDSAVLTPGEQVIIVDADGNTQSVFIVP